MNESETFNLVGTKLNGSLSLRFNVSTSVEIDSVVGNSVIKTILFERSNWLELSSRSMGFAGDKEIRIR